MNIAVIGTGAIGTAVARHLLAAGRDVVVWNRTRQRLDALVEAGAQPAGSPDEAVSASTLVLLTLTDYRAVRDVLATLPPGQDGRTVIALCTGSPADALDAAATVTALGARYLDAGNQSAPEAIGTDAATIMYSGDRTAFDHHLSTLRLLGSPRFAGPSPAAAAIWDLTLFGLWYDAQLGLLRAFDTVRTAGIDITGFADMAATQLGHVVSAAPATAAELLKNDFPRGPADLVEHLTVLRHLMSLRSAGPIGDGGLAAVIARIEALTAEGRSAEGLTAVIS